MVNSMVIKSLCHNVQFNKCMVQNQAVVNFALPCLIKNITNWDILHGCKISMAVTGDRAKELYYRTQSPTSDGPNTITSV